MNLRKITSISTERWKNSLVFPVGTGGRVRDGWEPCACPLDKADSFASPELKVYWGGEDKHKAPTHPNIHPLSLQEPFTVLVHSRLLPVSVPLADQSAVRRMNSAPTGFRRFVARSDAGQRCKVRTINCATEGFQPLRIHPAIPAFLILFLLLMSLAACTGNTSTSASKSTASKSLPESNGSSITYNTGVQDVLIRMFRGGGNFGTLEISPEVSIYGDGSYILGPGYQMSEGSLSTDALQQLLHTLVDTDHLLNLSQQEFSDTPDQNFTLLQLSLNGKQYTYVYGTFGTLSESAQAMSDYHHLDAALTAITNALNGSTHPYTGQYMALFANQDFSPDLTQNIPFWTFSDFTLDQLATYECGAIPQDTTSPNADTGCLTYSVPQHALLLSAKQQKAIQALLKGQQSGVFQEQGLYYAVHLRYLLPDELSSKSLAMFGSSELSYNPVPLSTGPVPQITPTPS